MSLLEKARTAASRPAPIPRITIDASFTPACIALSPISSPTFAAAKGVPFFAPVKPRLPLEDHAMALPFWSVKIAFVLLNVACTNKIAVSTFFHTTRK